VKSPPPAGEGTRLEGDLRVAGRRVVRLNFRPWHSPMPLCSTSFSFPRIDQPICSLNHHLISFSLLSPLSRTRSECRRSSSQVSKPSFRPLSTRRPSFSLPPRLFPSPLLSSSKLEFSRTSTDFRDIFFVYISQALPEQQEAKFFSNSSLIPPSPKSQSSPVVPSLKKCSTHFPLQNPNFRSSRWKISRSTLPK